MSLPRLGALLILGALAVHELRYRLGFGEGADEALHTHGHAYLAAVGPLIVVLAGLVLARGVARWASGRSTPGERRWRLTSLWPVLGLGLGGIFSAQELLEGAVAAGHPSGLAAVTAGGAWTAFAAAAATGLGLALIVQLAGRVTSARPRVAHPILRRGGECLVWSPPGGPLRAAVRSRASARAPPSPV